MKRLFSTSINQSYIDIVILIIRIIVASFMLSHGIPKLVKLCSGEAIEFADPIGIGATASLILTVFAEVFCSIFIFIGLGTRIATLPLIITMLVVAFSVHGVDGFNKQELPLLYLTVYVVLLIVGSGRFSFDRLIEKIK
jgi:putative oxidoreductase